MRQCMQIPWHLPGPEEARCLRLLPFLFPVSGCYVICFVTVHVCVCVHVCAHVCTGSRPLSLLQGVLYGLAFPQRLRDYTGQRVEAGGRMKGLREKCGPHLQVCRLRPACLWESPPYPLSCTWGWRKGPDSEEWLPLTLPCHIISESGWGALSPEPGLLYSLSEPWNLGVGQRGTPGWGFSEELVPSVVQASWMPSARKPAVIFVQLFLN